MSIAKRLLTIPLIQRIALFSSHSIKQALVLANVNHIFHETMIDFNTMHAAFYRCLVLMKAIDSSDKSAKEGDDCKGKRDDLSNVMTHMIMRNITWMIEMFISAMRWKPPSDCTDGKKSEAFLAGQSVMSLVVERAFAAGSGDAVRVLLDEVHSNPDDYQHLIQDLKENGFARALLSCDLQILQALKKILVSACCWFETLTSRDVEKELNIIVALHDHIRSPNVERVFTFLLDEVCSKQLSPSQRLIQSRILKQDRLVEALCESAEAKPELLRMFCDKFLAFDDTGYILSLQLKLGADGSDREFPLSRAAANSHPSFLDELLHWLSKMGILESELIRKTNNGRTPFLAAVAADNVPNVALLISQCRSQLDFKQHWLNKMVDSRGWKAKDLSNSDEMSDFLKRRNCWEVCQKYCAETFGVVKQSGERRQRSE